MNILQKTTQARSNIAKCDLYTPHTKLLSMFFGAVNTYERVHSASLRKWSLDWIYEVLKKEDEFTKWVFPGNRILDQITRTPWLHATRYREPFSETSTVVMYVP
jgi:hypothetical protein